MIFLHIKDSNERGDTFADFVAILLSKLGYRITNTEVRKSGRELDIQAISKITNTPLLVECKALSKRVTSPDFNKFYGIYEHEYKTPKGKDLVGILASLNGFNSEVLEQYNQKDNGVRRRFRIWGKEDILKFATDAELISDDKTVKHLASRSWKFELGPTILVIAKTNYFRIQLLKRDNKITHYIVYRAKCEDPTDYEIQSLKDLPVLKGLEAFNLFTRKKVLLTLAESRCPIPAVDLCKRTKQSSITVETELSYLKGRSLVERTTKDNISLVQDIIAFGEISKELLVSPVKYRFLQSQYFNKLNNEKLAEYCLFRRSLDKILKKEKTVLNTIFSLSPSSLNQSLFGDISTYKETDEHSKRIKANSKNITSIMRNRFYMELIPHLLNDLHDNQNIVLRNLQPIIGIKEEYHIVLANTFDRIFEIKTGSIINLFKLKNGAKVKAGQLVSADLLTALHSAITNFHLTQNPKIISEVEQIYKDAMIKKIDKDKLAKIANDIGVFFMNLKKWRKAKSWLKKGIHCSDILPQLHANLAIVLEKLGDKEGYSKSITKAKKIVPKYKIVDPLKTKN